MDFRKTMQKMLAVTLVHGFHIRTVARECGLSPGQPPILEYLAEKGSCTQIELATHLYVTPAAVAVTLKKMQQDGLIDKCTDSGNLRCNIIKLTQKGKDLQKEMCRHFDEIDSLAFEGFTEEEIDTLFDSLAKIVGNLEKHGKSADEIFTEINAKNGGSQGA